MYQKTKVFPLLDFTGIPNIMFKYDYLIVGAGLFGSVCARELTDNGYKCLVIDRRGHIGGNCYSTLVGDVNTSIYGGHYFSTDNYILWNYINKFSPFVRYNLVVKSNHLGNIYSYPINLMTMHQIWGITTPEEAKNKLESVRIKIDNPRNYEEKMLSLVGEELYSILIYGYSKKHWGMEPKEIPLSVANRISVRTYFEERYYTTPYQGVPLWGWDSLFKKMLDGIDVKLNEEFKPNKGYKKLIYTGSIDEYYHYSLGKFDYRCVKYTYDNEDIGTPMMAYPDLDVPYARKFCYNYSDFYISNHKNIVTATEYTTGNDGDILAYPINNPKNLKLYEDYRTKNNDIDVYFGGRLGNYRYVNMDKIIEMALELVSEL
jgi:UDP-galactopyranose mutase